MSFLSGFLLIHTITGSLDFGTINVHIAGIDPRTLLLLTLWSTCGAADAAVHLSRLTAATVTLVIHRHLQAIFEAHWLDGEAVVGTMWRAASRFHTHIK